MQALAQDVRYALRHLSRSPGFAATAVLILALGIGANTAVLSVLNALQFQQLPIKDPDGLIGVMGRSQQNLSRLTLIPVVDELERGDGPLLDVCAYNGGVALSVETNGVATQAIGALVTGRCFATFGVAATVGRSLTNDDAPPTGPRNRVVVIGHRFWTRVFGGDPAAVGKILRTEGVDLTIIGVLPPGFGGLHRDIGVDLFAPFDTMIPPRTDRPSGASHILGRLRPGVSLEEATAELTVRWPAILEAVIPSTLSPAERTALLDARPRVERIGLGISFYRTQYARPVTLVLGLTAVLFLLTAVNLGGLLLARLAQRAPELAVRAALGGSMRRLAQQMIGETLVLSLAGAILAIPASFAIVRLLVSFMPSMIVEPTIAFTPDLRVLGTTALMGLVAGVLMAALPVWIAARRRLVGPSLWDRTIVGSSSRWARTLLAAQVALSVVLLIGAGLLSRSLYLLQHVDLGVHSAGVFIARVMPVPNGYSNLDNAAYYPALLEELVAVPGIRSVGFARQFPQLTGEVRGQPIVLVGSQASGAQAVLETVSPNFFETVGIPLLSGRSTTWTDRQDSMQVAVVSESLSRALAPNGDILGHHLRFGSDPANQDVAVVGVVGNATLGNPRQADLPVFYRPALQTGRMANYPTVAIAADGDAAGVAASIREVFKRGGREYAHDIARLDDLLRRAPASERLSTTVAAAVAALAVLLVFVGVHGALAYSVSCRRREIGVRMAVGAAPSAVVKMLLREHALVTLAGVAIGLPSAFVAARLLRSMMFGIGVADPLTFVAASVFILALGLGAMVIPTRRAAALDPVTALRAD